MSSKTYTVNSAKLVIPFTAFNTSNCKTALSYTATFNTEIFPSYVTFSSTTMQVEVYTTSNTNVGEYTIEITGTSTYGGKNYSASVSYTLTIVALNIYPPVFQTALQDQTVTAGSSKSYSLPSITVSNGDSYSTSVNLGTASSFTKYKNG